jgi:hypothetical protein
MKDLFASSILELLSAFDWALKCRRGEVPGFDWFEFSRDPKAKGFEPVTARERRVWDELTDPRRHDEVVQFPVAYKERTRGYDWAYNGPYYAIMYECILKASQERFEGAC